MSIDPEVRVGPRETADDALEGAEFTPPTLPQEDDEEDTAEEDTAEEPTLVGIATGELYDGS